MGPQRLLLFRRRRLGVLGALSMMAMLVGPVAAHSSPTGYLEVCKEASGPGVSGIFSFTVSGLGTVSAPVGGCTPLLTVPAGDITVAEVAQPGYQLSGVRTEPVTRLVDSDLGSATATVLVVAGDVADQTVVYFANRVEGSTGRIQICKEGESPDVTGVFRFTVSGLPGFADVGVGTCSDEFPAPEGTVQVTEKARDGLHLTYVHSVPPDRILGFDSAGGIANVSIVAGSTTRVTFRNQIDQGRLKICKVAGSGVAANAQFTFAVGSGFQTVPAGPAPGGYCSVGTWFPIGTVVTVTEQPFAGVQASAITVQPPDRISAGPDLAGATVSVRIGAGFNELTFTNQAGGPTTTTTSTTVPPSSAGKLGNFVWDDLDADGLQDPGEPGVGGVSVHLYRCDNTSVASMTTAPDGSYLFSGLAAGCYVVEFLAPGGRVLTVADAGSDDGVDSDANRTTGRTANITLPAATTDLTWDAGLVDAKVAISKLTLIPRAITGADVCKGPDGSSSKPTKLTFAYVGDTTATVNTQASGKASASGAVGPLPALVVATSGSVAVSGDANLDSVGDTVDLQGTSSGGQFSSSITVMVGGQTIMIHTSCSQPLLLGDQFGALKLVGFVNPAGSGSLPPPSSALGVDGATGNIGDPVTWNYVVTNPGSVALVNVSVADDNGTPGIPGDDFAATFVSGDDGDGKLEPGEQWLFRAAGTVTTGHYQNVGTVTADGASASGTILVAGLSAQDPSSYTGSLPAGDQCDTHDKPIRLTLQYTGTNVVHHRQDPSKVGVSPASIAAPPTAYIKVTDKATAGDSGAKVYFSGDVVLGSSFVADATNAGGSFSSQTYVYLFDHQGGTLLQSITFHTSCSQPLQLGDEFGNVKLVGYADTPSSGGSGGSGTSACPAGKKPQALTFLNQGGTVLKVRVTDKAYATYGDAKVYFAGSVAPGAGFTTASQQSGQSRFPSEIYVHAHDGAGHLIETVKVDTSCSKPLYVGQQFGSSVIIEISAFVSEGQAFTPVAPSGFQVAVATTTVKDKNLDIGLANFGAAQVIDSIDITWPVGSNNKLKKVKLDGATLFDQEATVSSLTVPGAIAWKGKVADRTLTAGDFGVLRFEFDAYAAPTGYAIVVHFVGGGTTSLTL